MRLPTPRSHDRQPVLHCFSGPYRQVGMALYALPRNLVSRPWYLLMLEVDERAGVFLFTRTEEDPVSGVSHEWMTAELDDLPALVTDAAFSAEGAQAVESVLSARCAFVSSDPALAPISPRGAFGGPFDHLRGSRSRAFVLSM